VCFGGLKTLACWTGETPKRRKAILAYFVGSYFRVYHNKGGDTNLLAAIEGAGTTNTFIGTKFKRDWEVIANNAMHTNSAITLRFS